MVMNKQKWMYSTFMIIFWILLLQQPQNISCSTVTSTINRQKQEVSLLSSNHHNSHHVNHNNMNYNDNKLWYPIHRGGSGSGDSGARCSGFRLNTSCLVYSWKRLRNQLALFTTMFIQTIHNNQRHLIAAAIARSTSILIMYPIDVIKTKLQLKQTIHWNINILFTGVTGSLIGQVPYGVLTFGSYEMYKQVLLQKSSIIEYNIPQLFIYAIAAILGDLTGSVWLCPSEVVKQQVQAGIHPNTISAIKTIYQNKGLIGFYQGYISGISRDIPFRVAQLTTFEFTKNMFLKYKIQKQQQQSLVSLKTVKRSNNNKKGQTVTSNDSGVVLTPIEAAICGAISGTFSAAITSPLDRFKTLLMTSKDTKQYGSTVISCAINVWQKEGIRGFTAGIIPRVIYIAPSVVIFFVAYEMSQQKLKQYYDQKTIKVANN